MKGLPKADLIYFAAQPDDVLAGIAALRGAGVAAPILGGDGLDIGERGNRRRRPTTSISRPMPISAPTIPTRACRRSASSLPKPIRASSRTPSAALGYDTARLLMAAIKSAGSTNPQAVRKALAATHDFAGVTGTISYRNGSRIPAKSVSIIAVTGGRQSLAASVLPEKIPAP